MNIFKKAMWCRSKGFSQNENMSCIESKSYIQKIRGTGGLKRSCKDRSLQHFWSSWSRFFQVSRSKK